MYIYTLGKIWNTQSPHMIMKFFFLNLNFNQFKQVCYQFLLNILPLKMIHMNYAYASASSMPGQFYMEFILW